MSNRLRHRGTRRTRSTGRSYTQRLQRTQAYRPPRRLARWLTESAWLTRPAGPALLILLAEVGHLAAAWTEWPAGIARGAFHVGAAAILGVVAVTIYFDPTRVPLAVAATVLAPVCWAVGALAGLTPYRHYPVVAAGIHTALELVAAGLLGMSWLTVQRSQHTRRAIPR